MGLIAGRRASVRCICSVPNSADVLLSIGPKLTVQLSNLILGLTRWYTHVITKATFPSIVMQTKKNPMGKGGGIPQRL